MFVGGAPDAVVFEAQSCVVPEGIEGPVAIFLTKSSTPLASNLQIQNKADIAFGPGCVSSSLAWWRALILDEQVHLRRRRGFQALDAVPGPERARLDRVCQPRRLRASHPLLPRRLANDASQHVNRRKGNHGNAKNDNNSAFIPSSPSRAGLTARQTTIRLSRLLFRPGPASTKPSPKVLLPPSLSTSADSRHAAIKGHNAIKSESSAPSSGAYNYRRNYRKPEKRGNGDVREVGWSMVRRA